MTAMGPRPRSAPLRSAQPTSWRVADAGPFLSCLYGCACFWCGCRGCRHFSRDEKPTMAFHQEGGMAAAEPDDGSQIWLDHIDVRM